MQRHISMYQLLKKILLEGVKTNLFGTKKLAELAVKYHADKFLLVSTDKVVNPTSMMGVTKRAAEIFCQSLDEYVNTKFITTRFGNVLDSTGSVVPLFP